nr:Gfo/Idh/MocA family oxidoreductase [Rhodothermus marinus]
MVADPSIDAIWICGPNHARIENMEAIVDALERGKGELVGVACEKPLARNVPKRAAWWNWWSAPVSCTATWKTSSLRRPSDVVGRSSGSAAPP